MPGVAHALTIHDGGIEHIPAVIKAWDVPILTQQHKGLLPSAVIVHHDRSQTRTQDPEHEPESDPRQAQPLL